MTTNVTDLLQGMMACDSRWSVDRANFVIFIDDTGFDKIVSYEHYSFMFAGDGRRIQEWKSWVNNMSNGIETVKPSVAGIAMCIVDRKNSFIEFEQGQDICIGNDARFAGTGSIHAHTCWKTNKNAKTAVDSAKLMDVFSGGEVKYLDFSGASNVTNSASIYDVEKSIATKGVVMYKSSTSNSQVSVVTAAANDVDVAAAVNQIANGSASVSAPCDAMHNEWSEADKRNLASSLQKIFGNLGK